MNKLHRVLRVRKGYKNTGMQEDNLLSLSYGRIIRKSIDAAEGLLPESFETYQIVEPGNIVMRLTDLQNDKRSLRQGLVRERGIITSAYDALELENGHDPRFWAYALLALDLAKYYYSMGGGVRQSIKFSDFPNDWISTPDTDTQKAIADFLDRETTRIDQLIEKKQRLVDVLKDKYKAEKKRLVFDLDNQSVQRSASTVPWFPDLPIHWHFMRSAQIFNNLDSRRIPLSAEQRGDLAKVYPYYGASGVIDAVDDYLFDEDTILVGEDGANLVMQSTPIAFKASGKYWVNNHAHILTPRFGDFDYWIYALNEVPYEVFVTGSAQPKLTSAVLGNIRLPVPPPDEQEEIASKIKAMGMSVNAAIEPIRASIDRLKEYRAALITAAVTGQINVGAAISRGATNVSLDGGKTKLPAGPMCQNADPSQARRLVAAEIIYNHRNVAYLGRIKVHKIMFLAEAHANINEIKGCYRRQAAGPYDGAMIDDVEAGLRQDQFYDAAEDPNSQRGRITFTPLTNAGEHKPTLEAMLGDRVAELRRIIGLVQDFSTENTEAIATLYAVWNDALIDGEQPDDNRIIRGFREEWHEAKQRFTEENLRTWLGWMRRHDLVPRGSGPHTIPAHQPSLF